MPTIKNSLKRAVKGTMKVLNLARPKPTLLSPRTPGHYQPPTILDLGAELPLHRPPRTKLPDPVRQLPSASSVVRDAYTKRNHCLPPFPSPLPPPISITPELFVAPKPRRPAECEAQQVSTFLAIWSEQALTRVVTPVPRPCPKKSHKRRSSSRSNNGLTTIIEESNEARAKVLTNAFTKDMDDASSINTTSSTSELTEAVTALVAAIDRGNLCEKAARAMTVYTVEAGIKPHVSGIVEAPGSRIMHNGVYRKPLPNHLQASKKVVKARDLSNRIQDTENIHSTLLTHQGAHRSTTRPVSRLKDSSPAFTARDMSIITTNTALRAIYNEPDTGSGISNPILTNSSSRGSFIDSDLKNSKHARAYATQPLGSTPLGGKLPVRSRHQARPMSPSHTSQEVWFKRFPPAPPSTGTHLATQGRHSKVFLDSDRKLLGHPITISRFDLSFHPTSQSRPPTTQSSKVTTRPTTRLTPRSIPTTRKVNSHPPRCIREPYRHRCPIHAAGCGTNVWPSAPSHQETPQYILRDANTSHQQTKFSTLIEKAKGAFQIKKPSRSNKITKSHGNIVRQYHPVSIY